MDTTSSEDTTDPAVRVAAVERMLDVAAAIGNEEPGVDSVLETFYSSFRDLVPYDRMEYARVDGDTLETVWVHTEYQRVELRPGFRYTRRSDRPFDRVPYIQFDPVERAGQEPADHPVRLLVAEGIRSALSCPLTERGATTGYLFFCSRAADTYTDFHVWVMTRIAAVAAGALANARLTGELERRNRELRRLDAMRSRYIATISHELRTPLTSVVGLSLTLRDDLDGLAPGEISELAHLIWEQAHDMSGIVEDLLVLARSEAGDELSVSAERVDLAATALDVADSLGVDVSVTGHAMAVADPGRVRQVLRNLVTNARRHGGPDIAVEVAARDGGTQITVSDDGDGVAPEMIDSLFTAFAHSGNDRESVGLGLWVSKRLAELMGGALEYRRVEDRTVFRLRLPAAT